MRLFHRVVFLGLVLGALGTWAGYAIEITSNAIGRQIAIAVIWWERSEERLKEEITSAIEEDRLDDAERLITMNSEYGYPHDPLWDSEIARRSTFFYAAQQAPKQVAKGVVYGDTDSTVAMAASLTTDFVVLGDIRDLVREGYKVSQGEEMDKLVAGLAAIGLLTTYATPVVDGGVSVAKALARQSRKQGKGIRRLLTTKVNEVVDYAELEAAFSRATYTPEGVRTLAGEVKRNLHFERASAFFADLGTIRSNAGGTVNAMFLLKRVGDNEGLQALKRASASFGEKTALMVRLGGDKVIRAFSTAFQKMLWLASAILMSVLGIFQVILMIFTARRAL